MNPYLTFNIWPFKYKPIFNNFEPSDRSLINVISSSINASSTSNKVNRWNINRLRWMRETINQNKKKIDQKTTDALISKTKNNLCCWVVATLMHRSGGCVAAMVNRNRWQSANLSSLWWRRSFKERVKHPWDDGAHSKPCGIGAGWKETSHYPLATVDMRKELVGAGLKINNGVSNDRLREDWERIRKLLDEGGVGNDPILACNWWKKERVCIHTKPIFIGPYRRCRLQY